MRTFKLNEISAVDRPAQAGARMTILKRDSGMPPTTAMKGIENMTEAELQKMVGDAVTAATAALTKELGVAKAQLDALPKPPVKKADPAVEPEGDDATLKAWRPYVAKAIADAVTKVKEEHAVEIAKRDDLAKTDETFTAGDGTVIRKSEAGENTFKVLKAQEDRLQIADFTKRAETEIPTLPGETVLKAKALRAVSKLDKVEKDAIEAMLKAGNAAMKANMASLGHNVPNESSATGQLKKMVDEHAKANKVNEAAAYEAVLSTPEGQRLYAAEKAEKRAA